MTNSYMAIFLDLMEYLNTNARKMGANNIKDLCYKAMESGKFKRDDSTYRFIHFCKLRNDIAHGNAQAANELTKEVVLDMYYIGIFLLFLYSEEWEIKASGNDYHFYRNGTLEVKLSDLYEHVKTQNSMLFKSFDK